MVGLRVAALALGITIGVAATAASGMMIFGLVAADSPAPVPPHRHYKSRRPVRSYMLGQISTPTQRQRRASMLSTKMFT
jgi:hypothetical protein